MRAPLPGFSLIELAGADVIEWLQGQTTGDVRALAEGRTVSFCICSPTGQMISVCDAYPKEGKVWISCPSATVAAILARVEQMVITEEVEATHIGGLMLVFDDDTEAGFSNRRFGLSGRDVWTAHSDPAEDTTLERLLAGEPQWGSDMDEKTLPPEMGPQFESRHVSYQKGCYVGQEILMRLHSRGHTNRTWVGLLSETMLSAGADVVSAGVKVGRVTSSASQPKGSRYVAAAMVRHGIDSATVEGQPVEITQMPISLRSSP
jgi:folate-binding protein YgfZ